MYQVLETPTTAMLVLPEASGWRQLAMDETYSKVKGVWKYFYRAVDKEGRAVDFLLTARRDKAAAMRFFDKAMQANDVPEKVTMDKRVLSH